MKLIWVIGFFWFLSYVLPVAAGMAVWPGDELTVTCVGCDNEFPNDYSSFYIDPNVMQVMLYSDGEGDWYENGLVIAREARVVAINSWNEKEIRFVKGSQSRTVYLKVKSVRCCLPTIDEVYFTDDEDRGQVAVGQTITIRAKIDRNDCADEDYVFGWEVDSDALTIENPEATTTDVYARSLPAGGRNPTIKAVVYNEAGDRREKSITVSVVSAGLPELKLTAMEDTGRTRNSIVVSRSGSTTPNEGAEIEHFYVTLYYYGDSGFEAVNSERDYGDSTQATLSASKGDGLYEVDAYVKDSYGAVSPVAKSTVRIGVPEEGIPNLYADKSAVVCAAGKACGLGVHYDRSGDGSYVIDWYDEKTGKKITGCQGVDCAVEFLNPGDYTVQARIRVIGESSYKHADIAVAVG